MADTPVTGMPDATVVVDSDVVPIVQSGVNKKSAFSIIRDYVQAAFSFIFVPQIRALTIDGVTHDLTTDRSWTTSFAAGKGLTGFSISRPSGLTTGKVKGFFVCPYPANISGYSFVLDTGTATVKTWKRAMGASKPTSANSISTTGVSITSGTAFRSAVVTDFTTLAVAANDIFAFEITVLTGPPTELSFELELTKT